MTAKNWGIVGGGMMGMTLAHRLAQQGHRVTLYEAAPELGGLVSPWMMDDTEWDKFYHVIMPSDMRTRGIMKDIGVDDTIEWVETKTGFYIEGKLYSMSDTIEFLKFPTLSLVDKFRLGLTIIAASKIKNWRRLEKIPVTEWLQKWSGKNTYEKIWLPLLKAKLGESYKRTSAVFIWATIQRLYGARKSGMKKEVFGFVKGGYKKVIHEFTATLLQEGVTIKTCHAIKEVRTGAGNKPCVIDANGKEEIFDEVILTLPSSIASSVCTGLTAEEKAALNGVEYLAVICLAVLMHKPISDFYITNITDSTVPFTGLIEMSALVNKKYLNGNSLLYLPKYVEQSDPLLKKSDEEIKAYFLENLDKMYPGIVKSNVKFAGLARAKHVITVAQLDYSKKLPGIKTSIPGVYIVNSSQIKDGTLNVDETITVAETKLEEILNEQAGA
jgi:protoporphyrinogen oxidase